MQVRITSTMRGAPWRELPEGVTVGRWCEEDRLLAIRARMAGAPPAILSALDIRQDPDGEFRIPVRPILLIGRRSQFPAT